MMNTFEQPVYGIQTNVYPSAYTGEASPYGPLPDESHQSVCASSSEEYRSKREIDAQITQTPQTYSTPATSPPTPSRRVDAMTTRSGRAIAKTRNPLKPLSSTTDRVSKSTGKKKKEKAKANRLSDFKMETPLSELTEKLSITIVDIEAYVRRSAEVRQKELETGKTPGKIKRPMNAFMLYRKAYQNVAKEWCTHNNHQVVSQVCGDSWPLEPTHIREQFSEWARIERDNHQLAHPGYKFAPSKPRHAKKKELEESDEGSDLDDWDWQKGRGGMKRSTRTGTASLDGDYRPPRSSHQHQHQHHPQQQPGIYGPQHLSHRMAAGMNDSTIARANPGKPLPTPYHQPGGLQNGQYWQQNVHMNNGYNPPYPHLSQAPEDVIMRISSSPTSNYSMAQYGDTFPEATYPDPGYPEPYPGEQYPSPAAYMGSDPNQHSHPYPHSHPDLHPSQSPSPNHHHQPPLSERIDPSLMAGSLDNFFMTDGSMDPSGQLGQAWGIELGDGMGDGTFAGGYDSSGLLQDQQAQILKGTDEWQIEHLDK
ncbi:HMG-box protein STE11 [Zalerion maritima]|uniref:HMG-box protein STE11 n=1 Tax=Zalerion maritima TaxID=339359 RepID=A0AAD5RPE7_9PEZI|nr:HMG-box protein STE11 [Zalerion maritima]